MRWRRGSRPPATTASPSPVPAPRASVPGRIDLPPDVQAALSARAEGIRAEFLRRSADASRVEDGGAFTPPTAELARELLDRFAFGLDGARPLYDGVLSRLEAEEPDRAALLAVRIIGDVAEQTHAAVLAALGWANEKPGTDFRLAGQAYGPLWQQEFQLHYSKGLLPLPRGWHPHIHLRAALQYVTERPGLALAVTDPHQLARQLSALLELGMADAAWPVFGDTSPWDLRILRHMLDALAAVRFATPAPEPLTPFLTELLDSDPAVMVLYETLAVTGVEVNRGPSGEVSETELVETRTLAEDTVNLGQLARSVLRPDLNRPSAGVAPAPSIPPAARRGEAMATGATGDLPGGEERRSPVAALVIQPGRPFQVVQVTKDADAVRVHLGDCRLSLVLPQHQDETYLAGWHAYNDDSAGIDGGLANSEATRLARGCGWPGDEPLHGPVLFVGSDGRQQFSAVPWELLTRALDHFEVELTTEISNELRRRRDELRLRSDDIIG